MVPGYGLGQFKNGVGQQAQIQYKCLLCSVLEILLFCEYVRRSFARAIFVVSQTLRTILVNRTLSYVFIDFGLVDYTLTLHKSTKSNCHDFQV